MRKLHLGLLPIAVLVLVLGLIAALTVFMVFVVDAPRPALYWLIGAASTFISLVVLLLLLLVNSNTRRPEGFDPNPIKRETRDPFGKTTEELALDRVLLPDGKPYGARRNDDPTVVARLISKLEGEGGVPPIPEWARRRLADAPVEPFSYSGINLDLAEDDEATNETEHDNEHAVVP